MKKILMLFAGLLMLSATVSAQSFTGKGDQQIGVGFSSGLNRYDNFGFQVNYGYGVHDIISVGGQVNLDFGDHTGFYVGPRVDVHLLNAINPNLKAPFDWYVGLTTGLAIHDGAHFGIGGFIGGQWNFAQNVGLRFEVGSNYMLGVSFSL